MAQENKELPFVTCFKCLSTPVFFSVIFFFSDFWKRPLTLNELLEEAENLDVNDDRIPNEIIIFPPDSDAITDEDSGDETHVDISNLPGRQLRADAEVKFCNIGSDNESDSEFDLPLSLLVKRKKK